MQEKLENYINKWVLLLFLKIRIFQFIIVQTHKFTIEIKTKFRLSRHALAGRKFLFQIKNNRVY